MGATLDNCPKPGPNAVLENLARGTINGTGSPTLALSSSAIAAKRALKSLGVPQEDRNAIGRAFNENPGLSFDSPCGRKAVLDILSNKKGVEISPEALNEAYQDRDTFDAMVGEKFSAESSR